MLKKDVKEKISNQAFVVWEILSLYSRENILKLGDIKKKICFGQKAFNYNWVVVGEEGISVPSSSKGQSISTYTSLWIGQQINGQSQPPSRKSQELWWDCCAKVCKAALYLMT